MAIEMAKSKKSRYMQPLLWVCKGLVVIRSKGCKSFGGVKLIICDLDK